MLFFLKLLIIASFKYELSNFLVFKKIFDFGIAVKILLHKEITSLFIFDKLLKHPKVIYPFLITGISLNSISISGAVKQTHIFGNKNIFSVK